MPTTHLLSNPGAIPDWGLNGNAESHIHALANTLRYCHLRSAAQKSATSAGGAGGITPPAASRQSSLASAPSAAAAALDAAAFAAAVAAEVNGGGGGGSMGSGPPAAGMLGCAGAALLDSIPEYDYMTQIVLRMFENKHVSGWVRSAVSCRKSGIQDRQGPFGHTTWNVTQNAKR